MRISSEQKKCRAERSLGVCSRIMRCIRIPGGLLLLALLHPPVEAAQSVTLAWDPSPDATVVGYNMKYGVASHNYGKISDVGIATSTTITGLAEGTTYFFAATSYDLHGLESDISNEIAYTVPNGLPTVLARAGSNNQVILRITGQVGHTYVVQASQNLAGWTVLGSATLDASGALEFVDPEAGIFPARFYRTQEQP